MAHVLIEHRVGDFETFKKVYLDDAERRERLGSKGGVVFRVADDPNNVIVVLEWETLEGAASSPGRSSSSRRWSGPRATSLTPRVTVLEDALQSPR